MAGVRYRDADGAERELRAPLVVGADGRRSLVAREAVARTRRGSKPERARLLLRLLARRRQPERRSLAAQWRQGRELVTAFPCDGGLMLVLLMPPVERARDFQGDLEGEYERTAASMPRPGRAARRRRRA